MNVKKNSNLWNKSKPYVKDTNFYHIGINTVKCNFFRGHVEIRVPPLLPKK